MPPPILQNHFPKRKTRRNDDTTCPLTKVSIKILRYADDTIIRIALSHHQRDTYNPSSEDSFSAPAGRVSAASPKHTRKHLPDICMVCEATPAPFVCPCKTRRYCSKRCYKRDWNKGGHKRSCQYNTTEDKM